MMEESVFGGGGGGQAASGTADEKAFKLARRWIDAHAHQMLDEPSNGLVGIGIGRE